MRRSFASLALLLALAGCVDPSATSTPSQQASTELLSIEPGMDTRALDGFEAIPGARVHYGEAALLVYRGDTSAIVQIRLEAGPAWSLASADVVRMEPREVKPIAIELAMAEGDAAPGPATLSADVLSPPLRPMP